MKKQNDNYFRLGLFVLAGIGILIALTLVFVRESLIKRRPLLKPTSLGLSQDLRWERRRVIVA